MIMKIDKTEKRYWIDNDKKYINFDKYKKDGEDKNEYEKNQKDKQNEINDYDNNDEDS